MSRADYVNCRRCGRHTSVCGPLSHTRQCGDCGIARLTASVMEQHEHHGPIFQRWRARIAASVGATIGADPEQEGA